MDWNGIFIVKNLGENRYQPMMITNKHVLNGYSSIVIRLRKKDSSQLVMIDMPIRNENGLLYSVHPDDKVDVAAVLLNGGFLEMNDLEFFAFDIDLNVKNSSDFLDNGGGEGSNIYMLDFPRGTC